jgi:hypothetical protein
MTDNTRLNVGVLGDTIRDIDKGAGIKTQVVVLDLGGSGVESLASVTNPVPVTGTLAVSSSPGLTNTELRATPVPVSGTVTASGPLTDTQLRATAVPVSGPLTNTELRAASVQMYQDPALLSPFGDLNTARLEPIIQLDFIYGINSQTGVSSIVTTGIVDTNGSRLRIQTGVGPVGAGLFTSRRPAHYRPGQGTIARFTAVFTAGVVNSTQIIGMGTTANGYFFGYSGATFGLLHRNGGVETWVAQTAWNGDKCDGAGVSGFNWNPLFGNVCQIKYPYLGYGNITFWVQDSATSKFILCHTIKYINTTAAVQLTNPNLNFYAHAFNGGNTSSLTMYIGSVGIFVSGERAFTSSPKWAADNTKAGITAETSILGLRNCTTMNGVANTGLIRLNSCSFSSSSVAKIAAAGFLRFRVGATLGGTPAYTPISGTTADNGVTLTAANSLASFDIAATTCTGGSFIYSIGGSDAGSVVIDLTSFNLFVGPGEILSLSGFGSSALFMGATVTWTEDQ